MASYNPDCDHCDRIKEGDEKYNSMNSVVQKQGCTGANEAQTDCLAKNQHDWKKCQEIVDLLSICVNNKKS